MLIRLESEAQYIATMTYIAITIDLTSCDIYVCIKDASMMLEE